jgi:restriction system protein
MLTKEGDAVKGYYRVRLGKGGADADECLADGFIGTDFGIREDLSRRLPDDWRTFNRGFIPIFLAANPGKTKIGAGLNCSALWTVSKGIKTGDLVLSPDAAGRYHFGEVSGDYFYAKDGVLPHRRRVSWLGPTTDRADLSEALRRSIRGPGTVVNVTAYAEDIEALLAGPPVPGLVSTDDSVEDPVAFAMEKHLEDFLVENWSQTELGRDYDIFEEDGERVGQQYPTDTGPMDILAISSDRTRLLVVELKRGRASDVVVGQVLRYVGYVQDELAEEGQTVRGAIIALEDDLRLRRALSVVPSVAFYRYEVSFKLAPG